MAPERSKDKPKNVALEFTTRFLCARSLDFWASVSLDLYIYFHVCILNLFENADCEGVYVHRYRDPSRMHDRIQTKRA